MKKIFLMLLLSVGMITATQAQNEADVIRKLFQVEKKAALADFLDLTKAEGEQFWMLYAEYEEQRTKLGDQRIALIEEYAKNYTSMMPEKADELVKKAQKLASQRTKLRSKYYKKSKKLIGSLKAASFFQFENYVENAIAVEIASSIPFIGEM